MLTDDVSVFFSMQTTYVSYACLVVVVLMPFCVAKKITLSQDVKVIMSQKALKSLRRAT